MNTIGMIFSSLFIMVHALIHLMGTTVYMKLGKVQGLQYKTTLMNGALNLGEKGIWVYGMLWGTAAVGFVLAMVAIWAKWQWGVPALVGVAVFSLVLTSLDYNTAFMGIVANLIILAAVFVDPTLKALVIK